jgi:hypothetical protein
MKSYELINKIREAVGNMPLRSGDCLVGILDSDSECFTAYGTSVIYWINGNGEKKQEPIGNARALYTAIVKVHGQVLGAVMAGKGFQGPWVSDPTNRTWAVLDVEADEHSIHFICKEVTAIAA